MVIPIVVPSPITCFGSILQWGVLRTHREAIGAQHAGVETQRTLQQRLAPPDDGQELPCPRLTSLQLQSQFQFALHKLQNHSRPVSLHNSPIISQHGVARIKPYEGNIKALFQASFRHEPVRQMNHGHWEIRVPDFSWIRSATNGHCWFRGQCGHLQDLQTPIFSAYEKNSTFSSIPKHFRKKTKI